MINSITATNSIPPQNKNKTHKKLVSSTGYVAIGFGTVCGITGMKSVKFSNKMAVHKVSAYLVAISTALHLGFVKGLDKFFNKS